MLRKNGKGIFVRKLALHGKLEKPAVARDQAQNAPAGSIETLTIHTFAAT